jgi:hypothetical protein
MLERRLLGKFPGFFLLTSLNSGFMFKDDVFGKRLSDEPVSQNHLVLVKYLDPKDRLARVRGQQG